MMSKKVMVRVLMSVLMVALLIFVSGCLDYKAYSLPGGEEDAADSDTSLVDEIAQIEQELGIEEGAEGEEPQAEAIEEVQIGEEDEPEQLQPEEVVEEVILPELTEEEEIIEEPMEDLPIITVKENDHVELKVNITDPDEDPVTYTFSKPLSKTGEWKTNYGDAGEYIVTLTATDGVLSSTQKIRIVVERVNVPPEIVPPTDITVDEGEIVTFEPQVSDPNKDPVTVTISEPLKSGTFETDHTSAGQYQIKISASDGELESVQAFTLTINDVNVLPEISGVEDLMLLEGEVIEIKPVITDLDEDEITLTISEPVGNDGIWETKFTDHGEYFVTITADDGKDRVIEKVKISIEDVNKPPVIIEISLQTS